VKRILRARIFARSGVSSYTSTKEITASRPVTCVSEYQKEKVSNVETLDYQCSAR
jgi:hypothetical protein